MSQTLMPGERDLGFMLSFEPQDKNTLLPLQTRRRIFQWPGVTGTTDFDSYKDLISRLTIKPFTAGSGRSGADFSLHGDGKTAQNTSIHWAVL